jgi:hypothetical protein
MPVKFKIGFQIDAETLFSIVAKFLPLENLTVEEVIERHPAEPRLPRIPAMAAARLARRKRASRLNLDKGVNAVVMRLMADGEPHRFHELIQAIKAAGYAGTGLGTRLTRLMEHGFVVRPEPGEYRLAKKDAA